jgi:HEAT repeats
MKTDVIGSRGLSVAQLRAAVFKGRGPVSRPLALSLLGSHRYRQQLEDLKQLLLDEHEDPRLRNMAAILLGRVGTVDAAKILERALAVSNELALRGVLQALGTIGRKESGPRISRLTKRRGLVGASATHAAALLAYRLGASGSRSRWPPRTSPLRVNRRHAQPIAITGAGGQALEAALESAAASAPWLQLTARGAFKIECDGDESIVLLAAEISEAGLAVLRRRKAVAGVVVRYNAEEDGNWEVAYHVLTQPAARGCQVFVATGKGHLVYAGTAQFKDARMEFEIRSTDRAGAIAVELSGAFEGGRFESGQGWCSQIPVTRRRATR